MTGETRKFRGYVLTWLAFVVPIAVLCVTPAAWPRWLFMWLLAVAVFATCKFLTWNAALVSNVPIWRHGAYLFAWPGLNAVRFLESWPRPQMPSMAEWLGGAIKMVLGGTLFWNASRFVPTDLPILLGWAGMVGVGLMLHFGLFQLLSCYWRTMGVDARPLMVAPWRSISVTEFWSKRWNMGFRDFTHQFLFGPLARRWGVRAALVLTFLFSGVIHDLVISIPAGGGYGLPTAFFLIQLLAITIERSSVGRRAGLCSGWRGWLFTLVSLLLPARLLFHDQFVTAIVIPWMHALGAT